MIVTTRWLLLDWPVSPPAIIYSILLALHRRTDRWIDECTAALLSPHPQFGGEGRKKKADGVGDMTNVHIYTYYY